MADDDHAIPIVQEKLEELQVNSQGDLPTNESLVETGVVSDAGQEPQVKAVDGINAGDAASAEAVQAVNEDAEPPLDGEEGMVWIESDDDDPDEQLEKNFGLSYDDHNYDTVRKEDRAVYEPVVLPVIGPLDEFGNVLPLPTEGASSSVLQTTPTQSKPSTSTGRTVSGTQYAYQGTTTEFSRSEPAIVARAPALRETNAYRVTAQSEMSPAFGGYTSAQRSISVAPQMRTATILRRTDMQGQPQFQQGGAQVIPMANGQIRPTVLSQRRPPPPQQPQQQQAGTPGAYQHIVHPTPNQIRRPISGPRPPINILANRGAIRQVPVVRHMESYHEREVGHADPMPQQITPPRRKLDVAPHRMTMEQRQQQQMVAQSRPAAHFQMMEQQQQQQPIANPGLIASRGKPLIPRGRAGSIGTRRRDDETNVVQPQVPQLQRSPQRPIGEVHMQQLQPQHGDPREMPGSAGSSPRKVRMGETYSTPVARISDQLPAQITEDPDDEPHHDANAPSSSRSPARFSPNKMAHILKPTPPHRMSQEEKTAHIAKHLQEKDKITTSGSSPVQVASIPVAVVGPTVKTEQQSIREKDEISRLANDLRMSAESFASTPPTPVVPIQQVAPMQNQPHHPPHRQQQQPQHHQMPSSSSGQPSSSNPQDVRHAIHGIQTKVEPDSDKRKRNSMTKYDMVVPQSAGNSSMNETPQGSRPRGRPKGSTGDLQTRNRWGSIQENENHRPMTAPRIGQGVRTLPPVRPATQELPTRQVNGMIDNDNEDSDSESEGVEEEDWTMRCHCKMTHGDGACVECEKCKTWQHTLCMSLKLNANIDGYECELCRPRVLKLTRDEAVKIQKKELAKLRKATLSEKKRGRKSTLTKETRRSLTQATSPAPTKSEYADGNEYSRSALKLLKSLKDTVGAEQLLYEAKRTSKAKRLYVDANTEGLVATENIQARAVVMEMTGYVVKCEETTRLPGGSPQIYQYDGLLKGAYGEDLADPSRNELICVDTKKKGNDARFTRRSCNPNCVLKHVLDKKSTLGVMIVATRNIDENIEIFLPFDNDWIEREVPMECAEHRGSLVGECVFEKKRLEEWEKKEQQKRFEAGLKAEEDAAKLREKERKDRIEKERQETKKKEAALAKKQEEDRRKRERTDEVQREKRSATPSLLERRESVSSERKSSKRDSIPAMVATDTPKLTRDERKLKQYATMIEKNEEKEKKKQAAKIAKDRASADEVKEEITEEIKEEVESPMKRSSARVAKLSISSSASEAGPSAKLKRRDSTDSRRNASITSAAPPTKKSKMDDTPSTSGRRKRLDAGALTPSPSKRMRKSEPKKIKATDLLKMMHDNACQAAKMKVDFEFGLNADDKPSIKVRKIEEKRLKKEEKEEAERVKADQAKKAAEQKKAEAEEKKRKAEKEEKRRLAEEAERKKKAEEKRIEEEKRKKEEAERKKEEAERKKKAAEEEEKRKKEEAERKKKEEEEEKRKREPKKLSMEEYKQRRSVTAKEEPTTSTSAATRTGFIPSTEGASVGNVSLSAIALDAPGGPIARVKQTTPPPPSSPNTRARVSAMAATTSSSSDDIPAHSMSLSDRIADVFGGGDTRAEDRSTSSNTSTSHTPAKRQRTSRWQ